MPTPNVVVRLAPELREPAEARAKAEHRTLTEVIRSALRQYLTGDDGGEALTHAVHRAEAAEAELERTRAALAAARAQKSAVRATDAERQAKASLRAGQEARLVAALEAATREDPATAPRLAVLSGYGKFWCRDLARALAETGYLERTGPGQWIAVPGKDISEAMPAAKRLAQSGAATIAPNRREAPDGSSPATVPAVPAETAVEPAAVQIGGPAPRPRRTATKQRSGSRQAPLVAAKPALPPRKLAAQRAVREAAEAGSPRPADGQAAVIAGLRETVPGVVTASELPPAPVFLAGPDVDCAHGNMRGVKGVCPDCKQWVTK